MNDINEADIVCVCCERIDTERCLFCIVQYVFLVSSLFFLGVQCSPMVFNLPT